MSFLTILLYNLAIWLYGLGIRLYAPFNSKASLWVKGRKDIFKRLSEAIQPNDKIFWMHCASVGEFEQGRPVLESLREKYPQYKILLTFFSPSGYELRSKYAGADYVFYLPLDSAKNAHEFVRMVRPKLAIFVKYEFWYHYLHELHVQQAPTLLISAIFRKDQFFFKNYGKKFSEMLTWYKQIFVQDENSFQLLKQLSLTNVTQSSDTRFDRVAAIAAQAKTIPLIELFKGENKIMIGGSTWQPDEELLIRFINEEDKNHPAFKYIIVPHEIDKAHIASIKQKLKVSSLLFSEANEQNVQQVQVMIIDNVGMLSSLYHYSAIALVGGGFGKGIHNVLEAAVFGAPVIFGPEYGKFKEAVDLIKLKGGNSVADYSAFSELLNKLTTDGVFYKQASLAAKNYVQSRVGATEQVMEYIIPLGI
jgi:3-deoxy-D-manno-octulosonic-acid transferase